jgi:hypothetical protein
MIMPKYSKPPNSVHVSGMIRGEEMVLQKGPEPGRGGRQYRSPRDSTSINEKNRGPIHPAMPDIPPQ